MNFHILVLKSAEIDESCIFEIKSKKEMMHTYYIRYAMCNNNICLGVNHYEAAITI